MLPLRQRYAKHQLGTCQLGQRVKRRPSVVSLNGFRQQSSAPTPGKSNNGVIFSGIQPTGVPHLGNYLGALRQWATLQDEEPINTKLIYSIVDLHAITTKPDPAQLRIWRRETLATMLAIGLNPERSTIFYQSAVQSQSRNMLQVCSDDAPGPSPYGVDVDLILFGLCRVLGTHDTVEGK